MNIGKLHQASSILIRLSQVLLTGESAATYMGKLCSRPSLAWPLRIHRGCKASTDP